MTRDMVATLTATPCSAAQRAQCAARVASGAAHLRPQCRRLGRADARGAARTRPRRHRACGALPLPPAPDRAGTDAEEAGGLGRGEPGVDRSQQPFAEVGRVLLHALPSHTRNFSATRSIHTLGG